MVRRATRAVVEGGRGRVCVRETRAAHVRQMRRLQPNTAPSLRSPGRRRLWPSILLCMSKTLRHHRVRTHGPPLVPIVLQMQRTRRRTINASQSSSKISRSTRALEKKNDRPITTSTATRCDSMRPARGLTRSCGERSEGRRRKTNALSHCREQGRGDRHCDELQVPKERGCSA